MKHLFLFVCIFSFSIQIYAQEDATHNALKSALLKVDSILADGKYEKALEILYIIKKDSDVQHIDTLRFVDDKINEIKNTINPFCPNYDHPHAIDLGLPSGTKWACCNVGATKPQEYGGYFAWGETKEKDLYNADSYTLFEEGSDYTNCISKTVNDVAQVNWGQIWSIPTSEEIKELTKYCIYTWINMNGVCGGLFTGPNGKSIFMPAAGFIMETENKELGNSGNYQSGDRHPSGKNNIYYIFFYTEDVSWGPGDAICGNSIRPVSK